MQDTIYLDHNATTPLRPRARASMEDAMDMAMDSCGNPSSVHRFGRLARRVVDDARDAVAALIGAKHADVIFTSGGTEANVASLAGTGRSRVLVSAVEHVSVMEAVPDAEVIPVDQHGIVDLAALEAMLADGGSNAVVSVMYANNETGVLQPIERISELARRQGALVHCDAVQGVGKRPISIQELDVDYFTFSAHKIGGPMGIGAIVRKNDAPLAPMVRGGGQERKHRGGTENVVGIAGFGGAAEASRWPCERLTALRPMRDRLESDIANTGVVVFGQDVERLSNTTCLALPGADSEKLVMALDLAGIAVSAGSACSSGKVEPSHVLAAMGVAPELAGAAIRVSLGWNSRPDDVDRFVTAWRKIAAPLTPSGTNGEAAAQ